MTDSRDCLAGVVFCLVLWIICRSDTGNKCIKPGLSLPRVNCYRADFLLTLGMSRRSWNTCWWMNWRFTCNCNAQYGGYRNAISLVKQANKRHRLLFSIGTWTIVTCTCLKQLFTLKINLAIYIFTNSKF